MIDVELPEGSGSSPLVRQFAACLASVTERPIADLPSGDGADLADAVTIWRTWLAGRGAGLVPIAAPERFNWPGYWIAVIAVMDSAGSEPKSDERQPRAVLAFGTPAGVVLSPGHPDLLGRATADLPVRAGYLVASVDPALTDPAVLPALRGVVEVIAIAERATGPMTSVDSVRALAGRGLAGDRYAADAGTFSPTRHPTRDRTRGHDLTLIQAEVLDQLAPGGDGREACLEARRNLVTRGIDLNALVGRRFRIGDVECLGQRRCEPCAHLERLTHRGILRELIHRGGVRADILTDGVITTGAVIETIDHA